MDDEQPIPIVKPWIILHENEAGKMECILAGEPGAGYRAFGLAIADIIRHVARAFGVSERKVAKTIAKEMNIPTTALTGKRMKHDA